MEVDGSETLRKTMGRDEKVAGVREKDELQHASVLLSAAKSEVKHFQLQLRLLSADSHMTKTL